MFSNKIELYGCYESFSSPAVLLQTMLMHVRVTAASKGYLLRPTYLITPKYLGNSNYSLSSFCNFPSTSPILGPVWFLGPTSWDSS